jgi:carboxyl-terminal processing protease
LSEIIARTKSKINIKIVSAVFGLLLVFSIGYGLGNGNLVFFKNGSSKNTSLPANLQYSSVEKIYDLLRANYDGKLDQSKLIEGIKRGLVQATDDPYTEYLTQEQTEEFNQDLNGTFSGIGAELSKQDEAIIVVSPIAGFPAEKAGLKPKDIIAEIDGKSTYGLSVSEAVTKIRGEVGTKVRLKIIRNKEKELPFTITRETITIPSVTSKVLEKNIGYIQVSRFAEDTTELVQKSAQEFKDKKINKVILDLRGNPGGLLESAVGVSDIWLKEGVTILQEKRGDEIIKTYKAEEPPIFNDVKTIVLIDEGSASASEIVAGALKDNNMATLIGVKSFGKGSVQSVENLPDGSSLKVTIARWYTPSGKNIDKQGIEPDIKIEQKNDSKTDTQLERATQEITR